MMSKEKSHSASVLVSNMDPVAILTALQRRGYFVMPLSAEMLETQEEMFRQFDIFDTRSVTEKEYFSLTPDAIGENNGWHGAGGLSRYNQCRQGIIFQASSPVWPMLSMNKEAAPDDFSIAHENFRHEVHLLAAAIMEQVAAALELPEPASYFTANGPQDIIRGSQFHVKKVMLSETEDLSALHKSPEDGRYLTLRAHRDPSVVSMVFHKHRHDGVEHGLGLQFKDPDLGSFVNINIPADEGNGTTGRPLCVIIAGSILELLSDGTIKAPLHRITSTELELKAADRLAATFFFQPNLDSLLIPFPANTAESTVDSRINSNTSCNQSDIIGSGSDIRTGTSSGNDVNQQSVEGSDKKTKKNKKERGPGGTANSTTPMTYGKWKAKAYGSYYKGK